MAAKGFKERVLIPALTEQEFSVREARAVIDAIFSSIKDALLRHERVELSIGSFIVLRNPKERGWRFGKIVTFDKYQVKFLPTDELNLAVAAAPPSPPRPKRKKKAVKSELTISAELIVDFIRENVKPGDWSRFFDELRPNPSISAMFKRVQPKPNERRPLSEAAQVIEECAPKEMPEDSRRRLDACLEWFARWTQRVIPQAIWQEALKEAKKILLSGSLNQCRMTAVMVNFSAVATTGSSGQMQARALETPEA